jgi:hypothetical protein
MSLKIDKSLAEVLEWREKDFMRRHNLVTMDSSTIKTRHSDRLSQ